MNRSLTSLLLILAIQCALVLAVYWPDREGDYVAAQPLLPFDLAGIGEIHIGDEFDNNTVLQKTGARWFLPELDNLPADSAMVESLLAALATGGEAWPVADSIAARQRFRVASYHYRRRIGLLQEEEVLGTVFLGASPGYRRIYARNKRQRAIHSIAFSAHDAPGHSGAWLDRKLLQVRAPVYIAADSYSLERTGEQWLSGIGNTPEPRELEALLSALRSLQIDGLAAGDAQRDLAETEADLVLKVQGLAGKVTLELFQLGEQYFVHSSEYPLFFTLGAYDYERLLSIDFRLISGAGISE